MAMTAAMQWEVRTTGSDNSSGGFDASGGGTDYSQQDAAQFSGTDLAATTATTTPVVTSATHNFVAADVGNTINITAGTNWTVGIYRIVSCAANAATLDRACASVASPTAGTWAEGGAHLTIAKALANAIQENVVWVKAGTYVITVTLTLHGAGAGTPNTAPSLLVGYSATRGDNPIGASRPLISTSSVIVAITMGGENQGVWNFEIDGSDAATNGLSNTSGNPARGCHCYNVKVKRFITNGFVSTNGGGTYYRCEVFDMASGATAGFNIAGGRIQLVDCLAYDNPCPGFSTGGSNSEPSTFVRCIADSNTGASSDGFRIDAPLSSFFLINCVAYNNGRDGVYSADTYTALFIVNSIFESNGRYGINFPTNRRRIADLGMNFNAFYANVTAARNNTQVGPNDVALSGSAFTDAPNGNFSLNSNAGAGGACRRVGFPGIMSYGGTGYIDIGTLQHFDEDSVTNFFERISSERPFNMFKAR